jgi:hypothetical protein
MSRNTSARGVPNTIGGNSPLLRYSMNDSVTLPNVQDEPRPWLARLVLLGARDVTAMVVGSGALLGDFVLVFRNIISICVGQVAVLRADARELGTATINDL